MWRNICSIISPIVVAITCFFSATAAYAGACTASANNTVIAKDAFSQSNCDTSFRDEELTCEGERNVWGACASEPIPHKRTKKMTFDDLSPYLWYSLPHPTEQLRKYDGPFYRGSAGDYRKLNQLISAADETGENRFAACVHQIEIKGNPNISLKDRAKLIRIQLDNCANQYILNAAIHPTRQTDPRLLVQTDRCTKPEPLTAKIACQPLTINPAVINNEYSVSLYIDKAWERMLNVPRPNAGANGAKFNGYLPKKRGFGPFDGLLGSIFNLATSVLDIVKTVGKLAELAQLSVQLPNFQQAMMHLKDGFKNFKDELLDIPGQIENAYKNITELNSDLGMKFSDAYGKIKDKLTNLPELYSNIDWQKIGDKIGDKFNSAIEKFPELLSDLENLSPNFDDLELSLETLKKIAPNFENLGNSIDNVGTIVENLQTNFPDTLMSIENLPGQIGTVATEGYGNAAMLLSNLPNQLPEVGLNISASVPINNPVDDIANHLNHQASALNSINNRLASGGSVNNIADNFRDAGAVVGDIPNARLAAGGLIDINTNVEVMLTTQQSLSGGTLQNLVDPSKIDALQRVSENMESLQQLESALFDIRQQVQRGVQVPGLPLSVVDEQLAKVRQLNGMLRKANVSQLYGLLNKAQGTKNRLQNAPLNAIHQYTNGVASNIYGLTNLNRFGNILQSTKGNVIGALGFGADLNFGSVARKMQARKDSELHPSLPDGLIIKNPLPSPENFPNIKLSDIAAFPYEQILEPTHPFSPRYHYYVNDRDGYSWAGEAYSKDPKNNVYCAGAREDDPNTEEDERIKVDVLEFRRKKFEDGKGPLIDGLWQRLQFNKLCHDNSGPLKNPCYIPVQLPFLPKPIKWPLSCSVCFNLGGKKTNNPPCSTNYQDKDRRMISNFLGGVIGDVLAIVQLIPIVGNWAGLPVYAYKSYLLPDIATLDINGVKAKIPTIGVIPGLLAQSDAISAVSHLPCIIKGIRCPAACTVIKSYRLTSMNTLCRNLRKPYTPINKLKMRYAKKDEPAAPGAPTASQSKLKNELPSGVPEGLMHKEYFKNRMPYPRLWDTGRSIQETPSEGQDPLDQNGQYTAIVGVGREAILDEETAGAPTPTPGVPAIPGAAEPPKDERCLLGGWGKKSSGVVEIKELPDPVTSWTELKLYQARTLRDYGMNCIGRYERLFKPHAQEDHVLTLTGATYQERSDSCKLEAGVVDPNNKKFQILERNIPRSWRGYAGDPGNDKKDAFPKFPGHSSHTIKGLDKARPGDILIFPEGTETREDKKGLPILSYVSEINLGAGCENGAGCYIIVTERNAGKWPDVCGNTDALGVESNRQLYKPGTLPSSTKAQIARIDPDVNIDCRDNDLQHCELANWAEVEIYRIREADERGGNQNEIVRPPVAAGGS